MLTYYRYIYIIRFSCLVKISKIYNVEGKNMSDISKKVIELVAECADVEVDEIKYDSRFIEDLNFDSIKIVEFLVMIEDIFNIKIDDMMEYMESFTTVENFTTYVRDLVER